MYTNKIKINAVSTGLNRKMIYSFGVAFLQLAQFKKNLEI